jgi:hypothetical protein
MSLVTPYYWTFCVHFPLKNFYISREHAQSILPVMRDLDEDGLTEVFPAPQIFLWIRRDFSHLGSLLLRGSVLVTL